MPNICSVCSDANLRPVVDALLNSGRAEAAVAKTVGLGRMVVRRHRANGHVAPTAPTAPETPSEAGRTGLRGPGTPDAGSPTAPAPAAASSRSAEELLKDVIDRLDAIDLDKVSPRDRIQVLVERRHAASDLARLGTPPPPPADAGITKFLAIVFRVLAKHPADLLEVTNAWRKHRGMAPAALRTAAPTINPSDYDGGASQ